MNKCSAFRNFDRHPVTRSLGPNLEYKLNKISRAVNYGIFTNYLSNLWALFIQVLRKIVLNFCRIWKPGLETYMSLGFHWARHPFCHCLLLPWPGHKHHKPNNYDKIPKNGIWRICICIDLDHKSSVRKLVTTGLSWIYWMNGIMMKSC